MNGDRGRESSSQEDDQPPGPINLGGALYSGQRLTRIDPALRIPETLTAHFTATGERWHQDQIFGVESVAGSCLVKIALWVDYP